MVVTGWKETPLKKKSNTRSLLGHVFRRNKKRAASLDLTIGSANSVGSLGVIAAPPQPVKESNDPSLFSNQMKVPQADDEAKQEIDEESYHRALGRWMRGETSRITIYESSDDEDEDDEEEEGKKQGENRWGEHDAEVRGRLEALRVQQSRVGTDHPDFLFSLQHLGWLHYRRGEYGKAQLVNSIVDRNRRLSLHRREPSICQMQQFYAMYED